MPTKCVCELRERGIWDAAKKTNHTIESRNTPFRRIKGQEVRCRPMENMVQIEATEWKTLERMFHRKKKVEGGDEILPDRFETLARNSEEISGRHINIFTY